MAIWRVIVVMVICITRINSTRYLSSESLTFATHEKRDIEFDEHPRIEVRHEDRIINDTLTKNGRYGDINVFVYAFKETFVLNLKLNRKLFASTYVEKVITNLGVIYNSIDHTDNNCYYIGRIQDKENSAAAISTCRGIIGEFTVANVSYHIERGRNILNEPFEAYRIRRLVSSEFIRRFLFTSNRKRRKRSFNWPQDKDGISKVLELYIANDYSQFVDKGNDTSVVFQKAKNIANFASSLYHIIGVYFVLVGMEVWTDADRFPILASDVDTALNSWYSYRMRNINPFHYNDNAVLLTRVKFYGQVIGKAIIGAMCSNQYSGEIVVDQLDSPSHAGSTMAHEIGHSFGLLHDSSSCSCPDSISHCIMYPSASSIPATDWSSCSLAQFNASFSQGLDICLYDVPQTIYEPTLSTCGNGIVENGEQCDCGNATNSECNPSCCSATTCQLIGTASCASGRCCDASRCQILAAGSLCRSSSSGCDLPEHCDGRVSTCPVDTYRPDGTPCTINGDSVYCYGGKCRSHNSQCQLLWGNPTNSSNSICYERFNVYGQHYGNCGYNWLPNFTYIACQQKDVMCGKLLCDTTSNQQLAYYKNYYLLSTASINAHSCNSVIFDFGLRVQDPGLVQNGASCGDGKVCVNQTCISVSSLQMPCSENCQGDQVCNNLGHCQSQRNEFLPTTPFNYADTTTNEVAMTPISETTLLPTAVSPSTTAGSTSTSTISISTPTTLTTVLTSAISSSATASTFTTSTPTPTSETITSTNAMGSSFRPRPETSLTSITTTATTTNEVAMTPISETTLLPTAVSPSTTAGSTSTSPISISTPTTLTTVLTSAISSSATASTFTTSISTPTTVTTVLTSEISSSATASTSTTSTTTSTSKDTIPTIASTSSTSITMPTFETVVSTNEASSSTTTISTSTTSTPTPTSETITSTNAMGSSFRPRPETSLTSITTTSPSESVAIPIIAAVLGFILILCIGFACCLWYASNRPLFVSSTRPLESLQNPDAISRYPTSWHPLPQQRAWYPSYRLDNPNFFPRSDPSLDRPEFLLGRSERGNPNVAVTPIQWIALGH